MLTIYSIGDDTDIEDMKCVNVTKNVILVVLSSLYSGVSGQTERELSIQRVSCFAHPTRMSTFIE